MIERALQAGAEHAFVLAYLGEKQSALQSQDRDLTIRGDARELARAIRNLLVNGIEHSPAGGGIHVSVREGDGSSVILSVIDEGGGIPEENLSKVFDVHLPRFRPAVAGA